MRSIIKKLHEKNDKGYYRVLQNRERIRIDE